MIFNFLFAVAVLFSANTFAQDGGFSKGQMDLNIGAGLLPTFYSSSLKQVVPPVSISFEYGVTDNISAGLYLGYTSAKEEISLYTSSYQWNYTYMIFGARGAYHFKVNNGKLDPYLGVMLGYNKATVTLEGDDDFGTVAPSAGGVAWSLYGGARYRFTDKLGVYGELGYGISIISLGLNVKF